MGITTGLWQDWKNQEQHERRFQYLTHSGPIYVPEAIQNVNA